MDPGTIGMLAGGAGGALNLIGQLIGYALASGDRAEADRLARQAMEEYNISAPDLESLIAQQGPSAWAQSEADPLAVEGQRLALSQLQGVARGADDIEYRAAMDRANRETNREASARDAGLRQEMQARGLGGSGQEYALRALSGQAAADRASARGFDAAAEGRRQALQGMQASGGLSGQMRGQDFQERSARAQAADEIARFNAASKASGYQQDFSNRMGLAGARAGAKLGYAGTLRGNAQSTQQAAGNVGAGAGQAVGTIGQNFIEEQRRREDRGLADRYWNSQRGG